VRRSWAALTVGLLVFVVAVLSFFLVRSTSEDMGSNGYRVWGQFHDATGLVDKSRVEIAGVSIGQIISRTLEPASRVRITIRIKPGVILYENAVIEKKAGSVLGGLLMTAEGGGHHGYRQRDVGRFRHSARIRQPAARMLSRARCASVRWARARSTAGLKIASPRSRKSVTQLFIGFGTSLGRPRR
jgi:phospholipid/cholesterol/gamma-HCH transport system substrate-binding protein